MASALKAGPGAGFMQWTYLVFSRLNSRYEQGTAESVLSWAIETFGTGLAVGTSFGTSGIVLMDMAIKIQPDVDIFYIDTGYFFPETNKLIDRIQDHYQRSLRRVLPNRPSLSRPKNMALPSIITTLTSAASCARWLRFRRRCKTARPG